MAQNDRVDELYHCPLCGGSTFRRSRLTISDLSRLMQLEIPIRCQDCGERATVLLPRAMKVLAASAKRRSQLTRQDD
jgi:DNA-directed RNA polymerase subunit RPC12/RpoP